MHAVNAPPVILVLEDERLPLLTLHSQLSALGTLGKFSEPERALEFARQHRCDAAVIDLRPSRRSMDGIGFLRALRAFDSDLAVIVRTADDSERTSDGAIEPRAILRAARAKTSTAELRKMVRVAIEETRRRRDLLRRANDADGLRAKWQSSRDDLAARRASAALSDGLIQGLRKRLTNLSVLTSLMRVGASDARQPVLMKQAERASAVIKDMSESIETHRKGAFAEDGSSAKTSVNECLAALGQYFSGAERWASMPRRLLIRSLRSDASVRCPPLRMFGALQDLAESLLAQVPDGASVYLSVEIVSDEHFRQSRAQSSKLLYCRPGAGEHRSWATFRFSAEIDPQVLAASAGSEGAGPATPGDENPWSNIARNGNGILSVSIYPPATMELSIPVEAAD